MDDRQLAAFQDQGPKGLVFGPNFNAQMEATGTNALIAIRDKCNEILRARRPALEKQLALIEAGGVPKPRAPRSDKGTTRKAKAAQSEAPNVVTGTNAETLVDMGGIG